MEVRWNLTGRRGMIKKSDILILSVAKSGRTWLRVMINKYLSLVFGVPFDLNDMGKYHKRIPHILFTHELWYHYSMATARQKMLGKYIVPDKMLAIRKVIILYRDPRDVLVSLYFQKTKRSDKKIQLSLKDFISDQRSGIDAIVQVMNTWRRRLKNHPDCFWISYEDLRCDTLNQFLKVLEFLNFDINKKVLAQQAVEFSQFENMKKMEANGQFKNKILQPGDPSDPNSFKVREGKVGGYVSHFSEEDLCRLNQAILSLDPFYGYDTLST